jgi:hypothetical protein
MAGHSFLASAHMPSAVVAHMDYYPQSFTLRITFTSGVQYDYKNVPLFIYEAMKQARSKGIFLNKFIKGRYECKKVVSDKL